MGKRVDTSGLFETKIQGIPCFVQITYTPEYKGRTVRGIQMEPNESAEADIEEIYDRKGYKAKWLWDRLDDADRERIAEEYLYGGSQWSQAA